MLVYPLKLSTTGHYLVASAAPTWAPLATFLTAILNHSVFTPRAVSLDSYTHKWQQTTLQTLLLAVVKWSTEAAVLRQIVFGTVFSETWTHMSHCLEDSLTSSGQSEPNEEFIITGCWCKCRTVDSGTQPCTCDWDLTHSLTSMLGVVAICTCIFLQIFRVCRPLLYKSP